MVIRNQMRAYQMKTLRIKDNSERRKEDFSEIGALAGKILDKTLEQLEKDGVFVFPETIRDSEDLDNEQMILRSLNDSYRSGNVMGFLGYGNERLIIESRFCSDNNDFFLQYLLEQAVDFPNIIDLETDMNQENRLFNMLLFLFPYYLKKAMRKGVFKTYIRNRYNDGNIRGTIDIARHLSKNTPFAGKVAYSQREYSYDNHLIQLVRHTIEFIKRKPYGNKLLVKVKDEARLIIGATPKYEFHDRRKIIGENKKNTIRHAYYSEYRALQHLCLLILQHQEHQIGSGSRRIFGIIFDGAWLWEEYINVLICDIFHHPRNKTGEGKQHLFTNHAKQKHGLIYPDYISINTEDCIIADAKYRPIENIGRDDYQQILAYMFRFDAKKGFFFYPATGSDDNKQLWLNSGSSYEDNVQIRGDVFVTMSGLLIPSCVDSYKDFVAKMTASEKQFRESLNNAISAKEVS